MRHIFDLLQNDGTTTAIGIMPQVIYPRLIHKRTEKRGKEPWMNLNPMAELSMYISDGEYHQDIDRGLKNSGTLRSALFCIM